MRAVLAVLAALVAAAPAAPYGPGRTLCQLPAPITESSGIVASSRSDDVLFTHNDSGDRPRFYAVDRTCRLLATIDVDGATAVDWEDIARGPARDRTPALFLGDIGDNAGTRASVTVYEIPEPVIDPKITGAHLQVRATAHTSVYDDGPHDAETLLVDPAGRIIVVTKATSGLSGVYVAAGGTLQGAGTIDFAKLASPPPAFAPPLVIVGRLLATGGDVSPDGSRVIVRTYGEAFEWPVVRGDVVQAFTRTPQVVAIPAESQGEGIAYSRDGRDFLATSEGAGGPLDLVPAAEAAPGATTTSAPAGSAGAPVAPASHRSRAAWTWLAGGVAIAALALAFVVRRRRASAGGPPLGR